jgi:5-methylcytosine-specific restriction protein A
MTSFLITFKPASENPERGWPLGELQSLVNRVRKGDTVEEKWRFQNIKDVSPGDRAFLLLQGKRGPALIGYGRVSGHPQVEAGKRVVPITFENLVDPTTQILVGKDDLVAIRDAKRLWRTQSSGVKIPEDIAADLEAIVLRASPKPSTRTPTSNPDWTRDELIIALDVYLRHRTRLPDKGSKEIVDLSRTLNRLGEKLFRPEERSETFRNENGVYMKLMNFRRLDPHYTARGRTGLSAGAKAEEEVWTQFASDPQRCRQVADAIIKSLDDPYVREAWLEADTDESLQEAPEGRLLTRTHLVRERDRSLIEAKRKRVIRKHGKLACEVCEFDFSVRYGERGNGFIECHHTKPVATLTPGQKTHVDDLALVCANCHRMIHRRKPWLSIAELKLSLRR